MDGEQLEQLIRQPEGLKLEFKQRFYEIDSSDRDIRKQQRGELCKDILSLANGNVNVAHLTGYLVIGVGDALKANGTRDLYDVGSVKINSKELLEKVNPVCSPPLSDIHCETVLLEGERVFVISIPPSPHIHETKQELISSSGRRYPEDTVFIRRGECIGVASLSEVRAIEAAKQAVVTGPSHFETSSIETPKKPRASSMNIAAVVSFLIMVVLFSIWTVLTQDPAGAYDVILSGIAGAVLGAITGGLSAAIIWFVDRVTRSRTTNRETLLQVFWILTALGAILGALVGWFVDKTLSSAILGVPLCGLLGLAGAGVLVVLIVAIERRRQV